VGIKLSIGVQFNIGSKYPLLVDKHHPWHSVTRTVFLQRTRPDSAGAAEHQGQILPLNAQICSRLKYAEIHSNSNFREDLPASCGSCPVTFVMHRTVPWLTSCSGAADRDLAMAQP
jgi:hypothetical protein